MGSLDGLLYVILIVFWIAVISTSAWILYGIYSLVKWIIL